MNFKNTNVKRYRNVVDRRRVFALQFTGNNGHEVQEFLELKVLGTVTGDFLKCGGSTIERGDYVIRKVISFDDGMMLDIGFLVYTERDFKNTFRLGERDGKTKKTLRETRGQE